MNTENYVYKKEVDWSLFQYGLAIPLEYQVVFNQITDRFIKRGESKNITLYLNGKSFPAKLNNNSISAKFGNRTDIVQIRYSPTSEIAEELRGLFNRSYSYIKRIKELQEPGSKKHRRRMKPSRQARSQVLWQVFRSPSRTTSAQRE